MSCAYRLQTELPNVQVTVMSDDFTPNLTSDGSGGLWAPYAPFGTDPAKIRKWGNSTYQYLKCLALSPESLKAGVSCVRAYFLRTVPLQEIPSYTRNVEHFRRMTKEEARNMHSSAVDGYSYSTFTCEPKIYLPWITGKFTRTGGKVIKRRISDLNELCQQFDLVVNCSGLGAGELVDDHDVLPVKGQVIKVKDVNVVRFKHCLFNEDRSETYVIPGINTATLGGTYEYGVGDSKVDEGERKRIMDMCCWLEPALKNCTVEKDWVGLRPARKSGIRLEGDSTYHSTVEVIHNYGHGGIGVTLHWGCAAEVVTKAIKSLHITYNLTSKL
ncbi:DDO [Bugula neritina]|uniref:DDO n=1 Tax=Bugula neritina TaxID=10212 RepID=A0A7J7KFW4_BUGNE|nr:DDO [Bugula neritina]